MATVVMKNSKQALKRNFPLVLILCVVMAVSAFSGYWDRRAVETERAMDRSLWMQPEIEVVARPGQEPLVTYDAGSHYPVLAHFYITFDDAEGPRTRPTFRSLTPYNYSPDRRSERDWGWTAWAETEKGGPEAPTEPTKVCIYYQGEGQYGTAFRSKTVCTFYDPNDFSAFEGRTE